MLEEAPENTMTALALAEAHRSQGQDLEALVVYQEVASRCRLADVHLAMAEIYAEHGHPRQTLIEVEKLLDLEPNSVQARLVLEELQGFPLPRELAERIGPPPSLSAIVETRDRLLVEKSLARVEVEELQRKAALVPGQPALAFFALEAEKRLDRLENRLQRIRTLETRVRLPPNWVAALEDLSRVRGILTVTLISRDTGVLKHLSNRCETSPEQLRDWILEALDFLDSYPDQAKSWVLECQEGVVVLQILDPQHTLMVTSDASLNFGSLRFTLEKLRAELQECTQSKDGPLSKADRTWPSDSDRLGRHS